jgi:hypothetical protein
MLRVLGTQTGGELERTLNKFSDQKERLKKELSSFIKWKNNIPFNGSAPGFQGFGDSDKRFNTRGNLTKGGSNLSHAHLTHNLSIVYSVNQADNTLTLYGIYSHDDLGTGNPPNMQRQQQMATRWANMKFAGDSDSSLLNVTKKDIVQKSPTNKPDYTPKEKPSQVAPQKSVENPLIKLAKTTDNQWPQRNLYNQLINAKTKQEQLMLINKEAQYLNLIRQRNKLYPNQMEYMRGLQSIFNQLTQK